ncbi:hypothetical protein T439DRAFT_350243 [Meredithblackwellia eburnea MCA 4105]
MSNVMNTVTRTWQGDWVSVHGQHHPRQPGDSNDPTTATSNYWAETQTSPPTPHLTLWLLSTMVTQASLPIPPDQAARTRLKHQWGFLFQALLAGIASTYGRFAKGNQMYYVDPSHHSPQSGKHLNIQRHRNALQLFMLVSHSSTISALHQALWEHGKFPKEEQARIVADGYLKDIQDTFIHTDDELEAMKPKASRTNCVFLFGWEEAFFNPRPGQPNKVPFYKNVNTWPSFLEEFLANLCSHFYKTMAFEDIEKADMVDTPTRPEWNELCQDQSSRALEAQFILGNLLKTDTSERDSQPLNMAYFEPFKPKFIEENGICPLYVLWRILRAAWKCWAEWGCLIEDNDRKKRAVLEAQLKEYRTDLKKGLEAIKEIHQSTHGHKQELHRAYPSAAWEEGTNPNAWLDSATFQPGDYHSPSDFLELGSHNKTHHQHHPNRPSGLAESLGHQVLTARQKRRYRLAGDQFW